jgi:hypothetical protein
MISPSELLQSSPECVPLRMRDRDDPTAYFPVYQGRGYWFRHAFDCKWVIKNSKEKTMKKYFVLQIVQIERLSL